MKTSEKTNELAKAMSEFQSRLVTLSKDTKAYNYKYTTLASIWESFRPLLGELGLFIFQDVLTCDQGVKVATRITHISDQWIETDYILVPMGKKDAHGTGSATTYGRRYSLSCALGIVSDEDDDGAEASKPAPITADQATQIEDLIGQDRELLERVQSYVSRCGVRYLKELPSNRFNELLKNCQEYKAKNQEGELE